MLLSPSRSIVGGSRAAASGHPAFALIVAGQMGALLACRSDSLPFWRLLLVPNPLLWLGLLSEPLLAGGC